MTAPLALMLVLAADPRWGLTFTAPPSCIQPGELAERVERNAGRPLFGANPDLRVEGHLRAGPPPAKWSARLTLLDAAGNVLGTRDVTADTASCRGIDESLALVIGLMIDTKLKEPPPAPAPKPPEPALPPPPPAIERRPPTDDFSRLLRRERAGIFLGGYPVEQEAFYGMLGRADLQERLFTRRTGRAIAFVLGAVLVVGGGLLFAYQALADPQNPTPWAAIVGGVSVGAGIVGLIIGMVLRTHPTSDDEDDNFIEWWNQRQQVSHE